MKGWFVNIRDITGTDSVINQLPPPPIYLNEKRGDGKKKRDARTSVLIRDELKV